MQVACCRKCCSKRAPQMPSVHVFPGRQPMGQLAHEPPRGMLKSVHAAAVKRAKLHPDSSSWLCC